VKKKGCNISSQTVGKEKKISVEILDIFPGGEREG